MRVVCKIVKGDPDIVTIDDLRYYPSIMEPLIDAIKMIGM